MNKVYFEIEGHLLYLDFMLEEYDFIPLLYVCIDETGTRYIVLALGMEEERYLIERTSLTELCCMLKGITGMRDIFYGQSEFWIVRCEGETYKDDVVVRKDISEIPEEYLPIVGAKYQLVDQEHKDYARRIEDELVKKADRIKMAEEVQIESYRQYESGGTSLPALENRHAKYMDLEKRIIPVDIMKSDCYQIYSVSIETETSAA